MGTCCIQYQVCADQTNAFTLSSTPTIATLDESCIKDYTEIIGRAIFFLEAKLLLVCRKVKSLLILLYLQLAFIRRNEHASVKYKPIEKTGTPCVPFNEIKIELSLPIAQLL